MQCIFNKLAPGRRTVEEVKETNLTTCLVSVYLICTVVVTNLTLSAESITIALQRCPTGTNLPMISRLTPRTVRTWTRRAERKAILGQLVALLIVSAVSVLSATNWAATEVRIALEAIGTQALGLVVVDAALGIGPTPCVPAGVNAVLGAASSVQWAVLIALALI